MKRKSEQSRELMRIPDNAGEKLLRNGGVIARRLLSSDKFLTYCKARGIWVNRDRLFCLERLGMFSPVFRIKEPDEDMFRLSLPIEGESKWFDKGWAWDTTRIGADYPVPDFKDRSQESYYSVFQIYHLKNVLESMTIHVQLDGFLERPAETPSDWNKRENEWMEYGKRHMQHFREHEVSRAVALLCQYISDRYYPHTQGDKRTIRMPGGFFQDQWTEINAVEWSWHDYTRKWDPRQAEKFFDLTPEKLKGAYTGLAVTQSSCDPIEKWYQLVQFVSLNERLKLKGEALFADTLRTGAHMLRLLYKDLYKEELEEPNEVTGTIFEHFPELEIRKDPRRYLEFVVNRYKLNPQPTLCLFVEGASEENAVRIIFERYFGTHYGTFGIEIIDLRGVDTATGGKADRFRAIFRLVDYLHHHQTHTFLILDNENAAKKLKQEAKKSKSIHHEKRYITRPEYIKIWKTSFEFDNFSCSEICSALNEIAKGHDRFARSEILKCKKDANPGAALSKLYKQKTNYNLAKVKLSELLTDRMLAQNSQKKLENRPIIKMLQQVGNLAARNPLPTRQDIWEQNQSSKYLGKKVRKS